MPIYIQSNPNFNDKNTIIPNNKNKFKDNYAYEIFSDKN